MPKKISVEKPKTRSKKIKPLTARAPRRAAAAKPIARKMPPAKKSWSAGIARGSTALVLAAVGYLLVIMAVALAAAGYFTSESLAFVAEAAANQPVKIDHGTPSDALAPAETASLVNQETASSSSRITFLVTPSAITAGLVKVRPEEAVQIIGNAPGANLVEAVFTPTGAAVGESRRVIASGTAAEDGGFALKASFSKGALGGLQIKAYAKDDQATLSDSQNIAAE